MRISVDATAATRRVKGSTRTLSRALRSEFRSAARDTAVIYRKEVNRRLRAGTGRPGQGTLAPGSPAKYSRAIDSTIRVKGTDVNVEVFVPLNKIPYARIHELGGTVVAKNWRPKVKFGGQRVTRFGARLTVPVAREAKKAGRGLGHFRGFYLLSRRGKLLYARKKGKGRLEILYVLRKRVTIPKRPVWALTFKHKTPRVLKRWDAAGAEAVAVVGRA